VQLQKVSRRVQFREGRVLRKRVTH